MRHARITFKRQHHATILGLVSLCKAVQSCRSKASFRASYAKGKQVVIVCFGFVSFFVLIKKGGRKSHEKFTEMC